MNHTMTFKIQQHLSDMLRKYFNEYKRKARIHGKNVTLSGCANELIMRAINHETVVSKTFADFKVLGDVVDGELHIRDNQTHKIVRITRQENSFYCLEDKSTNCNHAIVAQHSDKAIQFFNDEEVSPTVQLEKNITVRGGDGEV